MGIETIAFATLTALSAASKMNQASAEAKSNTIEGNLATQEQAKKTRYAAARQTTSFLNSGLSLEGTPDTVIGETYSTGLQDIGNIKAGYDRKGKNIIAKGRSDAIATIASSFAGSSMGGSMGSMFEKAGSYMPESFSFGLNKAGFGNEAYKMLEMKDARG